MNDRCVSVALAGDSPPARQKSGVSSKRDRLDPAREAPHMSVPRPKRLGTLLATTAAVALACSAASAAAIVDQSGVIHGCYSNSTGALRVIDTAGRPAAWTGIRQVPAVQRARPVRPGRRARPARVSTSRRRPGQAVRRRPPRAPISSTSRLWSTTSPGLTGVLAESPQNTGLDLTVNSRCRLRFRPAALL